MDDTKTEQKNSAKYLGIHLDKRLNFNKHILETKNRAQKQQACFIQ